MVVRLSDYILEIACNICGKNDLRIIHSDIGPMNITTLTHCDNCKTRDVIRINRGELGVKRDGHKIG